MCSRAVLVKEITAVCYRCPDDTQQIMDGASPILLKPTLHSAHPSEIVNSHSEGQTGGVANRQGGGGSD